jgi:CRP-like cAMP-binding protein
MRKTRQQQIRDLREEALELSRKGDHKFALERLAELERLEPTEPDWPRRAADCHRALGKAGMQIAALGRAAELYGRAGGLTKAIAVCKMILALEPRHTETQARLAALQAQGPSTMLPPDPMPPPARPLPALPLGTNAPPAKPQTAAPRAPTAPPEDRSRLDLSQALRQRRVAQTKAPPPPAPAARAAPPPPPKRPVEQRAPIAPSFIPPPQAPLISQRAPDPNQPALPFLPEGSLNSIVPGSKPMPSRRGVPSGMYKIDVGDVRPPESKGREQRTAQQALPTTPLFSELGPASLQRIIQGARLVHLEAGGAAYRQGDAPDALYVVASGTVELLAGENERLSLGRIADGEFFGEAALIGNEPRQHTAEATEASDLLAIDLETIRSLIAEEPSVLTTVLRFLRERLVESSLLTNPFFKAISRLEGRLLAARFDFIEIDPGSLVIWQGVRSPGLFVLLSGAVEVIREDGEERLLASLRSGALFGEMSLVFGETAVADVRSTARSFALMLPKAEFQRVVDEHPAVLSFLRELAEARRRENDALGGESAGTPSPAP